MRPAPRSSPSLQRPAPTWRTGALVLACLHATLAAAAPPYAGRPLDEVLGELAREGGYQLVYNSRLVPAEARVVAEPQAGAPLAVLEAVLAPLGLGTRAVAARTYAIVRVATPSAAAVPGAGASHTEPLSAVVVTASRYALAMDVPDVHTFLTQSEVESLPRLADDALKAVHRLPGAASNGLAGLAHMRGGDASETAVLFDGLPLYEPFHLRMLQGPTSVLDERVVGGLDVYAGGFTAEYGDRMSAVIDARSVRPDADQYYELGVGLLHLNALASRRFAAGRGQWLVAARRSNLDEISDVMQSDLGEPTYADGFARVDFEWSPATRGSLHALLARDEAEVENSADTEHTEVRYANSYFWATLEHDWSDQLGLGALASYTEVESTRVAEVQEAGRREGDVHDDRDYHVLGLKLDAQFETPRWLHRAGLDARQLSAEYDYQSEVVFAPGYPFPGDPGSQRRVALAPEPSGGHFAAYYTLRGRLTGALTAELGLRWSEQTYGVDSDDELAPRVNLAWRLDEHSRLLASWGRYEQFQGIEELQVEDGIDEFAPAQHADHTIVGFEHDFGTSTTLRLETYRKDYRRLQTRFESLYDPLSLAPELRWDRVAIAPQSARAEGAEFLFRHSGADPWSGWFGYAWSRVTDDVDGGNVVRSWDQTHTLNGGIGWTDGGWQATLAAQYHTGWPVTPLQLDDTATDVALGARNSGRYAYFASVDARVSRKWLLRRGSITVHAEVTNALDRRNPCCTDFEFPVGPDGTIEIDADLRHWLPLVPSVGVLWKFQ